VAATTAKGRKAKRIRRPRKKVAEVVSYTLGHQTRVEILIALNEEMFTAQGLAARLRQSPSNIGNHLQRMLEEGSIEVGKEERRGNVTQYWYKKREIAVYTPEDAEAMTPFERQVTVGAIVQSGIAEVLAALAAETLSDPQSILYWDWYNLDAEGQKEADLESHRYLERLREIEAASTNRRAKSGAKGTSMLVKLAFFRRARKVKAHIEP
jgi:DNA-binding transcriptional ArsR family regulator